jgi:hypothetical protein
MKPEDDRRSLSDLLAAALTRLSLLAQTEIRLARAEISQKVTTAGVGIGLVAIAAVFTIPGLVLLLMALAEWLTQHGLSASGANAVAGGGALIVAALLLGIGLSRLRAEALKPKRTLKQLRLDSAIAKEHFT